MLQNIRKDVVCYTTFSLLVVQISGTDNQGEKVI